MPDAVALAFVEALPSVAPTVGWSAFAALPAARSQAAVSTDGTNIYITQGLVANVAQTNGYSITPSGVVTVLPNTGSAYYASAGAFVNGKHFAIGGFRGAPASAVVEAYTPAGANGATGTWTAMTSAPVALANSSAAVIGNFVYVAGGQSGSSTSPTTTASFMRYDALANTWTNLTPTAPLPAARTQGAMVAVGTKLYYLGGTNTSGAATNTVYVYDTTAGTWSVGVSLPGNAVGNPAVVVGGLIYYGTGNRFWQFDGTAWNSTATTTVAVDHGSNAAAVVVGSNLFYVSGSGTANVDKLDTAVGGYFTAVLGVKSLLNPLLAGVAGALPLTPPQVGWSTIAAFGQPLSGAAVSTDGTRIYRTHGYANSGGVVLANGTTITTAGEITNTPTAPGAARQGVAGAWCNGKHYAIGGLDGSNALSAQYAEAYTPAGANGAAGTWTTLAAMPVARAYMSAAVVGQFVYLAGGQNSSGASGAQTTVLRFDTVAGTWSTLNPLPAARTQGAMVAVGTKLYYLGGLNTSNTVMDTVYVFDTVAGTWSTDTPLPTNQIARAATVVGSSIYVFSGGTRASRADVGTSLTWATLASPPDHGSFFGAVTIGALIYLVSGTSTSNVDRLDPTSATDYAANVQTLRALTYIT